jgi:hypothetical protein
MSLMAQISKLSGPTNGGPLRPFSPSLASRVRMIPNLVSNP